MHQVSIDFVAGSHGNFLEFVCNKFLAKLDITFRPFDSLGASHVKTQDYLDNRVFLADHYVLQRHQLARQIIRITFDEDDLLQLSSVCFLRAGNANIDHNLLEHNTYNKLHNSYYKNLIKEITQAYPSIVLSTDSPDCPRYILREFFKFGFRDHQTHGLLLELKKMNYGTDHQVFDFAFEKFYNTEMFVDQIKVLAKWYDTNIQNVDGLVELHQQFLDNQIFKNSKIQADRMICAVQQRQEMPISKLSLLQESYINGVLERMYNIEMPFVQPVYFSNTTQIIEHLGL